ncbi:MAG: hypothetical protein BAJATHORv1_90023 [Candidatus Thorarchaeota archaeon]|nr:MAG: hypothetical protein BAJATHORv1_90023 [Candidatus Thorarchaeota archaeon]
MDYEWGLLYPFSAIYDYQHQCDAAPYGGYHDDRVWLSPPI